MSCSPIVVLPGHCDGLTLARKAIDSDPGFPVLRKPYQISALGRAIRQSLNRTKEEATAEGDRAKLAARVPRVGPEEPR